MIVGALLGLVRKKSILSKELSKLKLSGYKISIQEKNKRGVKAFSFVVKIKKQKEIRNLNDIYKIINGSTLDRKVKKLSKEIFLNLAKAEAKAHKTSIDKIHFHEAGAVDSIVDIVSSAILLDALQLEKIYASRMRVGRGRVKFCHGTTLLPVPAVRELLKDVPVAALNINKELTTPTGAAIIKTIADEFTDHIDIKIEKKAYGAGKRDLKIPNVLEVVLGEVEKKNEKLVILETNIDDMNPEFYDYAIKKFIKNGARDAYIQPLIMKKNRLGALLTVICNEKFKEKLIEDIFDETTTFGIRVNKILKVKLDRQIKEMKTKYGLINIKIGRYKGKIKTVSPEYEDCKKAAIRRGLPIKKIYDEVKRNI